MQPHGQATGGPGIGGDGSSKSLMVEGMPVTASGPLPSAAYDLTNYQPLREPVTLYRGFRRSGQRTGPARAEAAAEPGWVPFPEALRRELAKTRSPARAVLQVRCERRHPLLWLVPSRWGLVPVTRTSEEPVENPQAEVTELLPAAARAGDAVPRLSFSSC